MAGTLLYGFRNSRDVEITGEYTHDTKKQHILFRNKVLLIYGFKRPWANTVNFQLFRVSPLGSRRIRWLVVCHP